MDFIRVGFSLYNQEAARNFECTFANVLFTLLLGKRFNPILNSFQTYVTRHSVDLSVWHWLIGYNNCSTVSGLPCETTCKPHICMRSWDTPPPLGDIPQRLSVEKIWKLTLTCTPNHSRCTRRDRDPNESRTYSPSRTIPPPFLHGLDSRTL